MSIQEKLLTVAEFLNLYPDESGYELIEGEVIEVPPPKWKHGVVARRFAAPLGIFVDAHDLGDVSTDVGFKLSEGTICAPDVAFVSRAKLQRVTEPDDYFPFGPDLAVEVISPGNTADEIQTKINLYLAAGTSLVWIAYPKLHMVAVHDKNGKYPPFFVGMVLDGGDVLPGFSIPVAKLFPPDEIQSEETQAKE